MTDNLFADIPADLALEQFQDILNQAAFKLERIISKGHQTPPGEWYDQDRHEWVVLVQGSAGLLIEGEENPRELHPGDYLLLPAHQKHRVEWTDTHQETIWLALHFKES